MNCLSRAVSDKRNVTFNKTKKKGTEKMCENTLPK